MSKYNPTEKVMTPFDVEHVIADGRDAYNFSAGPCVLPKAVLQRSADEMMNYRGCGQSVMELSHRQDEFRYINIMTKREIKKFLKVPDNFTILLQQGGATMVYTSIAKNLAGLKPARKAMIQRTGMWSNQNIDELRKHCNVVTVLDNVDDNDCTRMVPHSQWKIDPEASFFCMCSNETVNGFEQPFENFPFHMIPKDIPVICDMSSNIGTCNVPWDNGQIGVVYMGAQKNLGTAGCTIIIVRNDLFGHADKDVPILSDWVTFENSPDKTYNTPAVWPLYVTGINVSFMNQMGGLDYYIQLANQRGAVLWDFINGSNGYYKSKITDVNYQSRINVIFRIQGGNTEMEKTFIREAEKAGIVQITGHSFNPGVRISMYNSMPIEGVAYLTQFMRLFQVKYPASN
jgi:phosphoserine aminotransferase